MATLVLLPSAGLPRAGRRLRRLLAGAAPAAGSRLAAGSLR